MSGRAFLDTNLFVYLHSSTDTLKKEQVTSAIGQYERYVSTQVLNEFSNVCIRKLGMPIPDVKKAVLEICETCHVIVVDDETVLAALDKHETLGYSFYDCLMLASALESGCVHLLSEDMADGQIVDGSLTIKNIFSDKAL